MPFIPSPTSSHIPPPPPPPAITPRAHPSTRPTDAVVIGLTTLLTISDFPSFYPNTSPDTFQPIYYALVDGSLLAPPFTDDLSVSSAFLIITACLLSIFVRNVCKATTYLWRGKVKKKALLYTLFLSQLLGLIAIIPIIVSQFSKSVNCALILRVFFIANGVSLSLLVTGVFGVKAYRCLDNNRLVSAVLVALRTAGSVVLILDLIHITALRSLSGRCHRPSAGLSSVFLILLLSESLFICACFLYAVRQSHDPVAVRGRVSVRLSFDDITHLQPEPRKRSADSRNRRAWSDARPHSTRHPPSPQPPPLSREPSLLSNPTDRFERVNGHDTPNNAETSQGSKRPISFPSTIHPHPPPPRLSTTRIPTTLDGFHLPDGPIVPSRLSTTPQHSPINRFTRYIPRMSLFREVMRDESCYTAITTAFTTVSAAMTLVGVKKAGGIDTIIWIALDWALISLLVVHSFGRAIRRHENESLLLHPSARYHDLHTDRTTAELLGEAPQPVRMPGMLSRVRARRAAARNNPTGVVSPSEQSTRRLFPGSTQSSLGDLHSLAGSTSGASNLPLSIDTESFARTRVSSTICMEDIPLRSHKSPQEWFSKNLQSAPPPPEPPDDEGHSSPDTTAHAT